MQDVTPTKVVLGVPLFNVEAISAILGISIPTVRELIKEQKIKYTKLGRTFYASEDALKEYLNGNFIHGTEFEVE